MSSVDLGIRFCGYQLENPFLLAATPCTHSGDMIKRAFDAGWAGAVWKTLGGIEGVSKPGVSPCYASSSLGAHLESFENIDMGNEVPLDVSFRELSQVKKEYPHKMVVASIRGEMNRSKWEDLARRAEDAGVDALELMFSCPHDAPQAEWQESLGESNTRLITSWVRAAVSIPVIVKMNPNSQDVRAQGRQAKIGGADALSCANTVRCILGVNLETLVPVPSVAGRSCYGGYSGPAVKPIVLRMIADLGRDSEIGLPLSAAGGVASWREAVEYMLLGATTVQVGTAAMYYGFRIIDDLTSGLEGFLLDRGFARASEMIGVSLPYLCLQPALSREFPLKARVERSLCIGCLRCYVACRDGGYQAIQHDSERIPWIDQGRCRGCSLCVVVCPVGGAIRMTAAGKDGEETTVQG